MSDLEGDSPDLGNKERNLIEPIRLTDKKAFSYNEVALLLGVSKRQVEKWVKNGSLQIVRFPDAERLPRVTYAQLESFLMQEEIKMGFVRPRRLIR